MQSVEYEENKFANVYSYFEYVYSHFIIQRGNIENIFDICYRVASFTQIWFQ